MKHNLRLKISRISNYIEIYISIIILAGILLVSINLIRELFDVALNLSNNSVQFKFTNFLSDALKLVIGIEFIKMLAKHTPESAIEVLLFAIARKLIVESSTAVDIITGVLAITILFILRRYFHIQDRNKKEQLEDV